MSPAKDPNSIGNVLIQLGYCGQADIDQALVAMRERRMGETLVELKVIDHNQLKRARDLQRMRKKEMTHEEERAFASQERSQLLAELSEFNQNALAFASKVNGS